MKSSLLFISSVVAEVNNTTDLPKRNHGKDTNEMRAVS